MSEGGFSVFLDANVLAKPVTRSLVIECAFDAYRVRWSARAEEEADRHRRHGQASVARLRERLEMPLSPTGTGPERFGATSPSDRQILADAHACEAVFLVTENVADFAVPDLTEAGISAVNPDLFLSAHAAESVYQSALERMAARMSAPARSVEQLHAAISRQHPRLFSQHSALFDIPRQSSGHSEPRLLFRGSRCLRCLTLTPADTLTPDGLCPACCKDTCEPSSAP